MFIDKNGSFYDGDLQFGDRSATTGELNSYNALRSKDVIRAQIKTLEQSQLMPRATREFMLLFMETSFTPAQLAQNIGYIGIKAFDNQITALRNQL